MNSQCENTKLRILGKIYDTLYNVKENYLITLGFTFNMFPSTFALQSFASTCNSFFASISCKMNIQQLYPASSKNYRKSLNLGVFCAYDERQNDYQHLLKMYHHDLSINLNCFSQFLKFGL